MENHWPKSQNVVYDSYEVLPRQRMALFSAATSVYLSFTAEPQGSWGGLSFPGIVGGSWLAPPGLWGTDIGRVFGRNAAIRVG